MPIAAHIEDKVRRSFASQALMTTAGATLTALDHGFCEITSGIPIGFTQQHGFAHAGLTFALGDSAAGYAALSVMPEEAEVLTAEIKINLLAPATGDALVARGRVIKPGRRLVIVTADVFALKNSVETHAAILQGTMIPV